MDRIAEWMGLTKAINYTNRMAWFKTEGDQLVFVAHVKDFDPRGNPKLLMEIMDLLTKKGAEFTVHHKNLPTAKYVDKEAVMEIDGQIHRAMGMNIQAALVNVIKRYLQFLTIK